MDEKKIDSVIPAGKSTRREILATGVKLGYAAPLVAASFKLSASGALATGRDDDNCCPDFGHDRSQTETFDFWLYAICHNGEFLCKILSDDDAQKHKDHGDKVEKVPLFGKVCMPECGDVIISPVPPR